METSIQFKLVIDIWQMHQNGNEDVNKRIEQIPINGIIYRQDDITIYQLCGRSSYLYIFRFGMN